MLYSAFCADEHQILDRLIIRVGFRKRRRAWEVDGELSAGSRNSGLHVGGGGVETFVQIKLQNEARVSLAVVGGDHFQARNLHELAFERRGHIVGHGFRRRARITHLHLNDGVVDCRQVADRQAQVREQTKQDDRDRQGNGHHRASDEEFGEVHDAPFCELPASPLPVGVSVSICTLPPGRTSN